MMSSSSAKIGCFNPNCKEAKPEKFRKGWRLRNGEFSELCDRCASAYEEGIYCDTFHSDAAGWRSCESCGKRVHCGCIVSFHAVALLEVGGVECIACANKNFIMAPNPMWPSPFFMHLPLPERLKDLSVKNWNQLPGPSAVAAQWRHAPNLWNTAMAQSELHSRMPYEIDKSNGIDKLISGDHPSASAMEKMKSEDPSEIVASSSLNFVPQERYANGNAGDNDPVERKKGVIAEPVKNTPAAGINYEAHSSVNMAVQSTSKDDTPSLHVGFDLPYASPNETNGPSKVSAPQSVRKTPPSAITKPSVVGPHNGVESSAETQVRNGRLRGDSTRARHQLLPRYWPRITDQELQQISGDSNSVITPLFEKMLSASDAGRIGRLVLPKKCAEAYFPAISQPEGLPLKVQDARGKEWIFQFRFWPNNNSRMYVLEGVTPCIQSMQLQAGDTVTFSRIDPEGKLVMGFRKASNVPPSDQETQTPKSGNGFPKTGEVNSADPSVWSKVDKSGYIAKEIPGTKASLSTKRKSSTLGSKSKRLRIENEDLIELKITWEEAQELLRPSPNHDPNVVMLEGLEIEEYEEAPILGRPTIFTTNQVGVKIQWVQCEDCSKWRKLPFNVLLRSRWTCSNNSWDPKRSTCSSPQELTTKQLEDLLSSKKSTAAPKKTKAAKQVTEAVEASVGLDTLANLAIPGEGDALPSSSQATTKHPRHRPGCTCIVCIQPPSGKGPKHKQTCTCNVCLTVKRRFRTLMLRHEKRRSEKEAETARKKDQQLQQSPKPEPQDDPPLNGNTSSGCSNPKHMLVNEIVDEDPNRKRSSSSPLKGQIDLNIQPEREDEPSSASDSCSKRLIRDANERYLREQKLSSSASGGDPIMIK